MLPAGIRSRTTNPHNLPVDDGMFSNFIRTPPTCGSTLTNYTDMPLNCTRTLPNCTCMFPNYTRTLPNYTRMFSNYIAQNPNKIAPFLIIAPQNPEFHSSLQQFLLDFGKNLVRIRPFSPENAPSRKCGALTLLDPTRSISETFVAVARP